MTSRRDAIGVQSLQHIGQPAKKSVSPNSLYIRAKEDNMGTKSKQKTAIILSVTISMVAVIASTGGLFLNGVYRDNTFVTSVWTANDFVTLVIAVPILIAALVFVNRGSKRAELIWLAMLDYMLYNYAFYLFAAAFNWFFLLYVALFALSIFALIFGLISIDVDGMSRRFRTKTPVKWISGYMLFVAISLSTIYISQCVNFILSGQLPAIIIMTEHPTNIVFALDLSLLVPVLVLGAIWLWRKQPWGYVLAGMSLGKGVVYNIVLAAGAYWATKMGVPGVSGEIPLWISLTLAGLIASFFLLVNLDAKSE